MDTQNVIRFLKQNAAALSLLGVGIVLILVGIGAASYQAESGSEVVVVSPSPTPLIQARVVVDIQGAVEKPGVYQLKQGDRVADAFIAAGGLSGKADRSYVARYINQAELLRDGLKIYIPGVGEKVEVVSQELVPGKVSINTANASELDSLWGVGAARAQTIIQNRPYSSLDELVTKAKLTKEIMEKNKNKLSL